MRAKRPWMAVKGRPRDLVPGYWIARAFGFGLVVAVFSGLAGRGIGPHHHALTIVQLSGIGVLLVYAAGRDLRLRRGHGDLHPWTYAIALMAMTALGGLTAQLGVASVPIAYSATASYEGGSNLPPGLAAAVTAVGIASVEVSGVIFGFSFGASVGWPVLLCSCTALGLVRRQSRDRAERLHALMEQMRHAHEQERRAAALAERHRIAREIHDVLAHSLSALGLQIEAARSVLVDTRDVDRALGLLDRAQALADLGLSESREAIHVLRTDSPPLPEALQALVERFNDDHAGAATLTRTGMPRPLPPAAGVALIRVAHEALSNASRHARGGAVRMQLGYGDDDTTLTIANDRTDAAPALDESHIGGYGLAGMRERVLLAGGTFDAGPVGDGWVVRARIHS